MRYIIAIVFCSTAAGAAGQIGGSHSFDFLQMPAHARVAALGGVNVSLVNRDVNFFHDNPALVGDTLTGALSAGYQFYVGDVGSALVTYAHNFPKAGQFVIGIQHINYGTLDGYDESGTATQVFDAGESAIMLGRTHRIGNFTVGATVKGVFSNIAGYRAGALLVDLGGVFTHPDSDVSFGLVIKNFGVVFDGYHDEASERLPFDVQAGVTLKPEHMPLRFSLTAYNLVASDLLYSDPTAGVAKPSRLKKLLSHVNVGAEILLHRNVNVLLGYNYLRHQTLRSETANAAGGICYGFSVCVKPVEFVFSRSAHIVGNAGYSFTLSTNMNQLLKRKNL